MAGAASTAAKTNPWMIGLGAAEGGITTILSAIEAANQRKRNEQQSKEAIAANTASDTRDLAFKESTLDPFRQQMAQAGAIGKLDRAERATYKPVHLGAAPGYEQYVAPPMGGFSYEKSPEMVSSMAALKRNVIGGNVAPSMTNPENYGKTAVLDLLGIASAGVDPGTVNGAGGAPRSTAAYTEGVPTRMAGGIGTSETRATDMSVADATTVLTRAIQAELGRQPQPGEIEAMLKSQGLKPGDRWVGAGGLNGLLMSLRAQAVARPQAPTYTGRG